MPGFFAAGIQDLPNEKGIAALFFFPFRFISLCFHISSLSAYRKDLTSFKISQLNRYALIWRFMVSGLDSRHAFRIIALAYPYVNIRIPPYSEYHHVVISVITTSINMYHLSIPNLYIPNRHICSINMLRKRTD